MRAECCNRRDGITCIDCPDEIRAEGQPRSTYRRIARLDFPDYCHGRCMCCGTWLDLTRYPEWRGDFGVCINRDCQLHKARPNFAQAVGYDATEPEPRYRTQLVPKSLDYELTGLTVECRCGAPPVEVAPDAWSMKCPECQESVSWPISWQNFSDSGCDYAALATAMRRRLAR